LPLHKKNNTFVDKINLYISWEKGENIFTFALALLFIIFFLSCSKEKEKEIDLKVLQLNTWINGAMVPGAPQGNLATFRISTLG
jgi:hypothetical protein